MRSSFSMSTRSVCERLKAPSRSAQRRPMLARRSSRSCAAGGRASPCGRSACLRHRLSRSMRSRWSWRRPSWPAMAARTSSRRPSTASSSTVAIDVESASEPDRMRSSTSSSACANRASAGKPRPPALPLMVCAARKTACSVSTSSGADSRRTNASSISRRFSSVSALKMASSSSRSKSIGSIRGFAPRPSRRASGRSACGRVRRPRPRRRSGIPSASSRAGPSARSSARGCRPCCGRRAGRRRRRTPWPGAGAAARRRRRAPAMSHGTAVWPKRADGAVFSGPCGSRKWLSPPTCATGSKSATETHEPEDGGHAARRGRHEQVSGVQVGVRQAAAARSAGIQSTTAAAAWLAARPAHQWPPL